jgi:glycosyltransferase involved in cell wall biosynthesis
MAPVQSTGVQATTPNRGVRVLAIGNMYPPHHAGGYELMWQAAMRHATAAGHRVRVLTTDYRSDAGTSEDDSDIHRTLRWYWDLDRYDFPRLSLPGRLAVERHNRSELRRQLSEFDPDVVSFWSMGCMSLSLIEQVRRIGLPCTFVVHDDWLIYGRQHDQWIRLWRGRRRLVAPVAERLAGVPTSVRLDGRFVFHSRYTLERARQAGLAAPATVVYPGIDDRFLVRSSAEPWRWRLAYVGRIDRQKGIDTAVRALVRLPASATLAVWGTGDDGYIAEMRELAARLGVGDRVRFEGWASAAELPSVYAGADAVVFPVRWEEPFGLVPLEAMGVGRPVISTLRGGTAEFLRAGENALAFAVDDDADLADCVRRLADDPSLRARVCEAGRRTAAEYTVERFARRTVEEMTRASRPGRAAAATRG